MGLATYEGRKVLHADGRCGRWIVTESSIRPASCRFELHLENEGEPSVFGASLAIVLEELAELDGAAHASIGDCRCALCRANQ